MNECMNNRESTIYAGGATGRVGGSASEKGDMGKVGGREDVRQVLILITRFHNEENASDIR